MLVIVFRVGEACKKLFGVASQTNCFQKSERPMPDSLLLIIDAVGVLYFFLLLFDLLRF
jgi:hypothetical protein